MSDLLQSTGKLFGGLFFGQVFPLRLIDRIHTIDELLELVITRVEIADVSPHFLMLHCEFKPLPEVESAPLDFVHGQDGGDIMSALNILSGVYDLADKQ